MTLHRATLTATLFLLSAAAAPATAQPRGNLVRGIGGDDSGTLTITRRNRTEIRTVRSLTGDGELSAEDLAEVVESAGRRVSPEEMAVVSLALAGKVPGGADFRVPDAPREAAVDLLYEVNLFDASRDALKDGDTYGGSEVPRTVKEVVARAKLNGAVAYVGTSGGIAKRAARGRDAFVNPLPLLEAWDFQLAEGLTVTSEHRTARPVLDEDRAIMFQARPAE